MQPSLTSFSQVIKHSNAIIMQSSRTWRNQNQSFKFFSNINIPCYANNKNQMQIPYHETSHSVQPQLASPQAASTITKPTNKHQNRIMYLTSPTTIIHSHIFTNNRNLTVSLIAKKEEKINFFSLMVHFYFCRWLQGVNIF